MLYEKSDLLFPLLICIGVAFALIYIFYFIRKMKLSKYSFERLVIIMCYSGIALYIGARLFDNLFHFIDYRSALNAGLTVKKPSYGGITFLGGYISSMAVFVVLYFTFLKHETKHILKILGIIATGFAIAHCFGRIGCFLSGCCYGEITESILGVTFPKDSSPFRAVYQHYMETMGASEAMAKTLTTKVLPTQLIEATFLFGLFIFLAFFKKFRFQLYALLYGTFRFIIEFYRFDNRGRLLGFISPSQALCILLIGAGIFALIYELKQKKKTILTTSE